MDENLPDLSLLIERLMRPYLPVGLGPSELMNDGTKMRLQPIRNGVPFADIDFVQKETFPTIDLAKAGIDIDRRPDTIHRVVEAMFRDQTFVLKPEFAVIDDYVNAALHDRAAANELAFFADVKLDESASEAQVLKAAVDVFATLHQVGIRLERKGATIEGLDLTHSIRGWRAAMVSLLIPLKSQEREVLNAVGRFVIADRRLASVSKAREKYVANGGGQWVRHPIVSVRLWTVDYVLPTFRGIRTNALSNMNDGIASLA